jgi:dienelactone hydrolase
MRRLSAVLLAVCSLAVVGRADGPQDNVPSQVRRIPPQGIAVPEEDRKVLEIGLRNLEQAIERIGDRPEDLRADVLIFHKAVHEALKYQEFFAPGDIAKAKALLREGLERAEHLRVGQAPWTTETGAVARGYISKIDGSVQPYGVFVPSTYDPDGKARYRLDLWFHGRGETLSEVNFLDDRRRNPGQFTPADTIVLHPYGRYCNANRFAGEVDTFEALEAVQRQYRVDHERIGVRGFSMGGAACWQFATNHADRWYAAAPGAGFSETARFLDVFQREKLEPTWFEQKLWRLYDCDDHAENLLNLPVVAYSGELDAQKQAADIMAASLKPLGVELTHVIGPQTKHAYHPEAKKEIDRRMDLLAARGRARDPRRVVLVTHSLKYNTMHWLTIDALGEHWEKAIVVAELVPANDHGLTVEVRTKNVTALTIDLPPGTPALAEPGPVKVEIDGQEVGGLMAGSDRSLRVALHKEGTRWATGGPREELRKRHDLQGPIDDAFMAPFVMVRPTGDERNDRTSKWVQAEMDRALDHWRRQFRGDARVIDDAKLGDEQIAAMNLVLWGDPKSNAVLARIADRLPIRWDDDAIGVQGQRFTTADHALVMIYPNPLNPTKYVVLNSGFTFREYDYLNNARQVPKLPDWAVIDLKVPPDTRRPGRIASAGFFDEKWQVKP